MVRKRKPRSLEIMKHSTTYLDSVTIVVFDTGRLLVIDKCLKSWIKTESKDGDGVLFRLDRVVLFAWSDGEVRWRKNNKLHRDDGPAAIDSSKTEWYQNGKLHRDDGPAYVHANGTKEWYQHGKLHRDDGPAVTYRSGRQVWYQHGLVDLRHGHLPKI